jgi:hypothetical protein
MKEEQKSKSLAISKSSQMLQAKPKKLLSDYSVNKDEYEVLIAIKNTPIAKTDNAKEQIIDIVAKWKWMVGVNSSNQDENEVAMELALISNFIQNNYSYLTPQELNIAIELSLTNKLNVDVKTYNSFSPMYVSRILNSYVDYRKVLYSEVSERKNKETLQIELESPVTAEYKMSEMIELIRYIHQQYIETGKVNDVFNVLYNYFKRTKRINLDKLIIEEAMLYGKKEMEIHLHETYGLNLRSREAPDTNLITKRFARNYCVHKYFQTLNLENLISSIKLKEFE